MLNYNSNQNLLKGIRSSNAIASVLYENRDLKRKVLKFLKDYYQTTGELPSTKFKTMNEVCVQVVGMEEYSRLFRNIVNTPKG